MNWEVRALRQGISRFEFDTFATAMTIGTGAHSGGDSVLDVLERAGVRVVFGIPSVHNLPIYDAIARRSSIRAITVRHEQAATAAADAWARTTGALGVCVTSTGPGAANSMGGLLEAFVSGSPVLHLTGQIETRYLGEGRGFIHEVPDQPSMLAALSKKVLTAASADSIASLVAGAISSAMSVPTGPVSVELPIDLQYAEAARPDEAELDRKLRPEVLGEPDRDAVARAASLLAEARCPLVWAGGGVVASGAEKTLEMLCRKLRAGVLTTPNARGVLDEHDPLCIGNLSWEPSVRALCEEADVLLAVGTRFQGPNTENWKMQLPARLVVVDAAPERAARSYRPEVSIAGDAGGVLSALSDLLGEVTLTEKTWPERVLSARDAGRARLRSTLGPQEALLDATERVLPAGTIVVKDSTIPAYTWGNRLLSVSRPRTAIMPSGFAIGLGLPHGVGAAAAAADRSCGPVVVMVGDGGIMLSIGELATLAREKLPAVVLCFSDAGYGILRNIQEKQYSRTIGVDLGKPDFAAVAQAMGARGVRVASVPDYESALKGALEHAGPTLIEVDLAAIGPMVLPYTGTSRPPGRQETQPPSHRPPEH